MRWSMLVAITEHRQKALNPLNFENKIAVQDPNLRAAARLLQEALNASTVEQEEALWCVSYDR